MVATVVVELLHVKPELMVPVLPSSKVPVATIWVVGGLTGPVEGLMLMDCRTGFWKKP